MDPVPTATAFDAIFSLIGKVGTFSFGPLVALILIGSYFGKWTWGWQHKKDLDALQAQYDRDMATMQSRLDDLKKENEGWKSAFLQVVGHTSKALELAQEKV